MDLPIDVLGGTFGQTVLGVWAGLALAWLARKALGGLKRVTRGKPRTGAGPQPVQPGETRRPQVKA